MSASSDSARWYRNAALTVISLSVVAVAGYFAWREAALRAEYQKSDEAEAIVRRNYEKATDDFFVRHIIEREQFIEAMQVYVLTQWRELEAEQRKLYEQRPSPLLDKRLKAMKLREQAWALMVDAVKEGSQEVMDNATRKEDEAQRIEEELAAELTTSKAPAANGQD